MQGAGSGFLKGHGNPIACGSPAWRGKAVSAGQEHGNSGIPSRGELADPSHPCSGISTSTITAAHCSTLCRKTPKPRAANALANPAGELRACTSRPALFRFSSRRRSAA